MIGGDNSVWYKPLKSRINITHYPSQHNRCLIIPVRFKWQYAEGVILATLQVRDRVVDLLDMLVSDRAMSHSLASLLINH